MGFERLLQGLHTSPYIQGLPDIEISLKFRYALLRSGRLPWRKSGRFLIDACKDIGANHPLANARWLIAVRRD
jgi:hypothetical protein